MKLEFNDQQSGVIPYRRKKKSLEVLLITSIKKEKWIIPKGFVEFNLTPFESAKKEAYEEAGIFGSNETIELGSLKLEKSIGKLRLKIFSLEVEKVADVYPDSEIRKRKWFNIEEAKQKLSIEGVVPLLSILEEKVLKKK